MNISSRAAFRTAAALALSLISISPTLAQTGPGLVVRPWDKDTRYEVAADAYLLDSRGVKNSPADLQISLFDARGRARLDPDSELDPHVGMQFTDLHLDSDALAQPADFIDHSIAVAGTIINREPWKVQLLVGMGYAGAAAYGDGNAWYGKADLLFEHEIDKTSSFGVVLDYNGNRSVLPDVPLPGFVYRKRIEEKNLTLNLGFPFMNVVWKPTDRWTIAATALIDGGSILVDYELIKPLHAFVSLDSRTESFHSDALGNSQDRVFYTQQRVEGGLRWYLSPGVIIVGAVGYAFDQDFTAGWDRRDDTTLFEPADAAFARAGLELHF